MKYCKKCVMPDTRPGITFRGGYAVRVSRWSKERILIGMLDGKNFSSSVINIVE